jgi:hypothetical protein
MRVVVVDMIGSSGVSGTGKVGIECEEDEYVRKGPANAFCIVEPKTGKRLTRATRRRANRDFARALARISKAYRKANGSISCSTT